MESNFYNLTARTPQGKDIPMSDFRGKAVLIVNTATRCGLAPQFEGLELLHQTYKDQGLVVLGFPCDQFMGQEPESNETLEQVCKVNHGVSFQLTEKCDVNGSNTHPIFKYLKNELGGLFGSKVKWNFTKFLIGKDGKPYKRYSPVTKPDAIEKDIQKLLL
ncbi:glutathione peroxidase [Desertivirga arenae]|uniref:glutathione peroxidase n=1 Tax=Desertivirga arenae TaxID=2810309 RepID=UPI001A95BF6A|nr:glutathione peroxidase [Pedobacter sp. SYSU D00823]